MGKPQRKWYVYFLYFFLGKNRFSEEYERELQRLKIELREKEIRNEMLKFLVSAEKED